MRKVLLFSLLLIAGLIGSQILPYLFGSAFSSVELAIKVLTMTALSFIMIHVGYEFDLDKSNLKQYGMDYLIAFTAAAFPWVFVSLYFVFVLLPPDTWGQLQTWKETLLAGRFASPTSAGVLFSMLAAAGLGATWLFKKARILAIFDDLDTVLLMIPLKMLMVGLAWQLGMIVVVMLGLLALAYVYLHRLRLPVSWPWVLGYAAAIALVSEMIYAGSKVIDDTVPIHLEVLLPAFVLGAVIAYPPGANPHADDAREGHQDGPESAGEQRVSSIISALFMVLVGLSMPAILGSGAEAAPVDDKLHITASQPAMSWTMIGLHVLAITFVSNLGKMVPAFCYRTEAPPKERLALAIGMWPRGEVGAGVLVVSLGYGIGGPVITIAMLSLALNLLLTGFFIVLIKKLLK